MRITQIILLTFLGLLIASLAVVAAVRAETITKQRDGFMTRMQGPGWTAESYRQGFTEHTTITSPQGTTHCRTWKQGWQEITQCD